MDFNSLGIAAAKTNFNTAEGITVDYVDPAYWFILILKIQILKTYIMLVKLKVYNNTRT